MKGCRELVANMFDLRRPSSRSDVSLKGYRWSLSMEHGLRMGSSTSSCGIVWTELYGQHFQQLVIKEAEYSGYRKMRQTHFELVHAFPQRRYRCTSCLSSDIAEDLMKRRVHNELEVVPKRNLLLCGL